ncbi:hypothetical protein [Nocardia sp. NPDC020380]|uniref:hypothetical protein n=1 Tax=Nocardia sp. NPDC020380 TaxID=3364309 RepID=UPI0037965C30
MSHPTTPQHSDASWAESIHAIRTLVQAQDLRAAKQQLRQLQTTADDETWAMVVEIANTLRFKTQPVALTKLRKLWRDNESFRPLIEACVPKTGEHQYIPQPQWQAPGSAPENATTWASKVRQRVDPNKRVEPNQRARTPNSKIIDDYEKTLATDERSDPGTPRPEPIIDRHDYDIDAITEVATTLCVSCRLERAAIDRHSERVRIGLGDDGLCGECRSLGRVGLPELSPGHSLADQTHTRLEFLAEHFPTQGRGIFRQEWRYADRQTRPIISAWVRDHTTADPQKEATRKVEKNDLNGWCENCGEYRQLVPKHARSVRSKELCLDCEPRYQQSGIPAGSIEARHTRYAQEIGDTREVSDPPRTSPKQRPIQSTKEVDAQQKTRRSASGRTNDLAGGDAERAESRRKLVESAREKARAAAQERRRTIGRRPAAGIRTRTIRH